MSESCFYTSSRVDSYSRDRTIALCSLFWEARLTGVDSQVSSDVSVFFKSDSAKAGTILHELTHLPYKDSVDSTIHKGTWDWGYGVVNCKMLASVAWTTAVKNADSFEYFAELMEYDFPPSRNI